MGDLMAAHPVPYAITAATFAGLDPDQLPDGQLLVITDDGNALWEVRGADGAHAFVQLTRGPAVVLPLFGDESGVTQPITTPAGAILIAEFTL